MVVTLTVVAVAPAPSGAAPAETVTRDGLVLEASPVTGVNPDGATISVSGNGFHGGANGTTGIYVAFCRVNGAGQRPTPCGGGADLTGTSGSSAWYSDWAPPYGENLAQPFAPGGGFQTTLAITARFGVGNGAVDCTVVTCAIAVFSDHTRLNDRSQDLLIPVSFVPTPTTPPTSATTATTQPPVGGPATTRPPTGGPATTRPSGTGTGSIPSTLPIPVAPTTTPTTVPDGFAAPTVVPGLDRRSAQAGTLSLSLSDAEDLDPGGAAVTVEGSGYDEAKGVLVALCALPTPGVAPGPCATGSAGASAWVSSNPPDYGVGRAVPYAAGGTFEVELSLRAVIDAETDCREVACAVVTRNDDTQPLDRSQDVYVPVSFNARSTSTTASDAGEDEDDESAAPVVIEDAPGGGLGPVVLAGGVVLVAGAVVALVVVGRRRARAAGGAPT